MSTVDEANAASPADAADSTTRSDRAAAVRTALRTLVAERGFHGASMSAVAKEAGVATGTAYVHYDSKEELVYATYLEIKADLAAAVLAQVDFDLTIEPDRQWRNVLRAVHHHFAAEPDRARFLTQLEESPFHAEARCRLDQADNPLLDLVADSRLVDLLVPLPVDVIYALSIGVVVKLVASDVTLADIELDHLITATWRAITVA